MSFFRKKREMMTKFRAWLQKLYLSILFIMNITFLVTGIAMIITGVYGVLQGSDIREEVWLLNDLPLETVSWVVMFVGIGILSITFCGFIGGWKEGRDPGSGRGLLVIYIFFVIAAVFTQMLMGIFMYEYHSTGTLDAVVEDYWFEETDVARERRIDYQQYFDCCGWADNKDSLASGYNTPCPISEYGLEPSSCRAATMSYLAQYYLPVAIFCISIAVLECIASFATFGVLLAQKEKSIAEELQYQG